MPQIAFAICRQLTNFVRLICKIDLKLNAVAFVANKKKNEIALK